MWSVKHTGYQGVVKDAYQRICLRMPAHEFLNPDMWKKVEDLVSAYMLRHILLEVDLKDSSLDYQHLEEQCSTLRDLTLPEEKLIFTCEVANYERDNTAIRKVMTHITPTVVLLKRCATRNKTLTMLKYLASDTSDLAEEGKKEADDEYNKEYSRNTEENTGDQDEEAEVPVRKLPAKNDSVPTVFTLSFHPFSPFRLEKVNASVFLKLSMKLLPDRALIHFSFQQQHVQEFHSERPVAATLVASDNFFYCAHFSC